MTKSKFNFWLAITYELLSDISDQFESLKHNKIVKLILNYCKNDWILWKVESALCDVDKQVETIKKQWAAEDRPQYLVIEHEPDGSKAQELLGGMIEIKSNFKQD